ncbi:hypothetical protein WOLCODRAFT_20224 [Wolfiporia cocos MD-104 SS10]|uniref:Uncharacterized protein n=1 Tax=Wolfiporia cocos (strain MD-104) TaxID=742152 RepID=A0A2H3J2J1_WOLCO|nr:hypothetical protein WOLCODRAFT_20224 [Wolfiporia cocos MD-104 SS10]
MVAIAANKGIEWNPLDVFSSLSRRLDRNVVDETLPRTPSSWSPSIKGTRRAWTKTRSAAPTADAEGGADYVRTVAEASLGAKLGYVWLRAGAGLAADATEPVDVTITTAVAISVGSRVPCGEAGTAIAYQKPEGKPGASTQPEGEPGTEPEPGDGAAPAVPAIHPSVAITVTDKNLSPPQSRSQGGSPLGNEERLALPPVEALKHNGGSEPEEDDNIDDSDDVEEVKLEMKQEEEESSGNLAEAKEELGVHEEEEEESSDQNSAGDGGSEGEGKIDQLESDDELPEENSIQTMRRQRPLQSGSKGKEKAVEAEIHLMASSSKLRPPIPSREQANRVLQTVHRPVLPGNFSVDSRHRESRPDQVSIQGATPLYAAGSSRPPTKLPGNYQISFGISMQEGGVPLVTSLWEDMQAILYD